MFSEMAPSRGEAARDAYLDEMDRRRAAGMVVVRCGHCGLPHASVSDVRECAAREHGA